MRWVAGIFAVLGLGLVAFLFVRPEPSKEVATALLRAHPYFANGRIAVVPRSVYVNPGLRVGEFGLQRPYTASEVGFIAPTVAALKALQLVDVTEYITAADTINLPVYQQGTSSDRLDATPAFAHTLMVQPREELRAVSGFADTSDVARFSAGDITVTMTAGWQFPIAVRELLEVTGVERTSLPFEFDAALCWRWRVFPAGELFAVGSETYDQIPELIWRDASPLENARGKKTFFDTDLHAAVARLARRDGQWRVVSVMNLDNGEPSEQTCSRP